MARLEPQHASDYDDRTIRAVMAVLLEIGQLRGTFRGKFAVIGGAGSRSTMRGTTSTRSDVRDEQLANKGWDLEIVFGDGSWWPVEVKGFGTTAADSSSLGTNWRQRNERGTTDCFW